MKERLAAVGFLPGGGGRGEVGGVGVYVYVKGDQTLIHSTWNGNGIDFISRLDKRVDKKTSQDRNKTFDGDYELWPKKAS